MLRELVLATCVVLSLASMVLGQQDGWRQLVSLVSTRAEVERVTGKPTRYIETYGIYKKMPDMVITVWYSSGKCDGKEVGSYYDVGAGLMTRLYATFRKERRLSDLQPDISKFTRKKLNELGDEVYYYSPDDSVVYKVLEKDGNGTVLSVSIQPAKEKEQTLKCQKQAL